MLWLYYISENYNLVPYLPYNEILEILSLCSNFGFYYHCHVCVCVCLSVLCLINVVVGLYSYVTYSRTKAPIANIFVDCTRLWIKSISSYLFSGSIWRRSNLLCWIWRPFLGLYVLPNSQDEMNKLRMLTENGNRLQVWDGASPSVARYPSAKTEMIWLIGCVGNAPLPPLCWWLWYWSLIFHCQSGRSPKVVAPFLLLTLVAI